MNNGTDFDSINGSIDEKYTIIDNLELDDKKKELVKSIIKEIREDNFANDYERGKRFEELIKEIVEGTKIFKCIHNKNTSGNEFDLLIKLNLKGRALRSDKIIPEWIPNKFLIECKNYKNHVKNDFVGKFYCLMDISKIDLGIFISKVGITGKYNKDGKRERYWKDAMAMVNKINLKYSESCKPRILLDLELNDIELVINDGCNIIDIIESRKDQIDVDVNNEISEWMSEHENSKEFLNIQ